MPSFKNYLKTGCSIVLNFSNPIETFTIMKSDPRYKKIEEKLINHNTSNIYEELSIKNKVIVKNKDVKYDGVNLKHKGRKLPDCIMKYLVNFDKSEKNMTPIWNFWNRLQKNPSKRAQEELFGFLMNGGISITENGCFVVYKKVRSNYMDIHSGTFDNSPGKTVTMPRNKVTDDPNQTCSRGLHVCSWEYLKSFGNSTSDKTVECLVDPVDVVSVPVDYNNTKMRVCKYKVIRDCDKQIKEVLYEDKYKDENLHFVHPTTDGRLKIAGLYAKAIGLEPKEPAYVSCYKDKIIIKAEQNKDTSFVVYVDNNYNIRLNKTMLKQAGIEKSDIVILHDKKHKLIKLY